MPRFISLIKFTEQGAKDIKRSTKRALAFDRAAAKSGVKVEGQYWTLGPYDGVLMLSAKKESDALHMLTELAALGYVQTETMQLFDDKEFQGIVGR